LIIVLSKLRGYFKNFHGINSVHPHVDFNTSSICTYAIPDLDDPDGIVVSPHPITSPLGFFLVVFPPPCEGPTLLEASLSPIIDTTLTILHIKPLIHHDVTPAFLTDDHGFSLHNSLTGQQNRSPFHSKKPILL